MSETSKNLENEVKKAIEEVRPQIQFHGGDVEFISIENGVVKIRLTGECVGCPMSQMTLQHGVGGYIKKKIPGVRRVEAG